MLFFDTPEEEKSLVKVVTDVLMGRDIETPRPLRIVLRDRYIEGADLPVYSISDHFFAMCDGTDGEVSLFVENYVSTFDGDAFDSYYIRIEGIKNGDLNVTVKEGQYIWGETIDDTSAGTIQGDSYVRVGEDWYPEGEEPEEETLSENAVAA